MGVPKKKRRTTARPTSVRRPQNRINSWRRSPIVAASYAWIYEVLSVLSGAISFLLCVSFLSHQFIRGSLDPLEVRAAGNLIGPIGHLVSTIMGGMFGWSTLVSVAGFALLAYLFWMAADRTEEQGWRINSTATFSAGFIGVQLFSAAFFAIWWDRVAGGAVGALISHPMTLYLGKTGASVLCCMILLLCVSLLLQCSSSDLLRVGGKFGMRAGILLGVTWPTAAAKIFWTVYLACFDFLGNVLNYVFVLDDRPRFGRNEDEDEEDEPLPKPRRRKNSVESRTEDLVIDEEPATHVVVKRRQARGKTGSIGGKIKKLAEKSTTRPEGAGVPFAPYEPPDLALLTPGEPSQNSEDDRELFEKSKIIEDKLKDFGITGRVTHVHPGPVITLFEFEPAAGVKVGKIAALQDDLSMSLRASSIRIIAPIPRRGTVGIEVPNKHRDIVRLRDVIEHETFTGAESILSVALGKDTYGDPVVVDIATMPHLLMAGSTGTGKSVCINSLLLSFLYRATPEELGLILIDPKILELSVYDGIPHLRVPVVTVPKQARAVLDWAAHEMNRRYRMMQKYGVRSIDGFNRLARGEKGIERDTASYDEQLVLLPEASIVEEGANTDSSESGSATGITPEQIQPLPKIVIVIDELADLMLTVGREIEELITRLAQKARAAGIHLILATQRPSVDVITGLIKANFPARMSFRVSSRIDSRTILDSMGAEKLLGLGDMLFMQPGGDHLKRVHGAFVSDAEVKRVTAALRKNARPQYDPQIVQLCEKALMEDDSKGDPNSGPEEYDSMYDKAVELVVQKGQASTSMVQRAFRIGYNRAARIIEMMERDGVIGPMDGVKPREVLVAGRGLNEEEQDDI